MKKFRMTEMYSNIYFVVNLFNICIVLLFKLDLSIIKEVLFITICPFLFIFSYDLLLNTVLDSFYKGYKKNKDKE